MALREKMAWLTLIGFLLTYAYYFGVAGPAVEFGKNDMLDIVRSFGPVAALHGLITAAGSLAIFLAARRDASHKADERDRAIDRKATSVAYAVMMIGVLIVGGVAPFTEPAYKIVNGTFAVVVISEIVRDVMVIMGYRRGVHG
ncbi:hypothetical protein OB03_08890 [Brevundimonas sp. GN22]